MRPTRYNRHRDRSLEGTLASNGIRIGVVGVNFGAQVQLPGLISEGYEVVAVCARRKESAQACAEKFGVPHAFTDLDTMLKMPGLDAVSIVTPNHLHHPMGMAALRAGKHLLLEKPFAVNMKEAWDLLAEAKKRTTQTAMVGHEFRFAPPRMYIKELLGQGYVGKLNLAMVSLLVGFRGSASAAPPWSPAADLDQGGGLHKGLGSHYIDCLRDWFGDINGVSARLATNNPDRTDPSSGKMLKATADDAFGFAVTFQRGGWATMVASLGAPLGPGARFEMYGSEGTLVTSHAGANPTVADKVLGGKVGEKALHEMPPPARHHAPVDERDHRLPSFRMMVQRFAEGVRKGTSPEPNFLDGFRSQQVMDGIVESNRTGRFVPLELSVG